MTKPINILPRGVCNSVHMSQIPHVHSRVMMEVADLAHRPQRPRFGCLFKSCWSGGRIRSDNETHSRGFVLSWLYCFLGQISHSVESNPMEFKGPCFYGYNSIKQVRINVRM
jgi:hypothetical protein